jgi:hypothetical protein
LNGATSASAIPEFLTTEEAAVFLHLSPLTLAKLRIFGGGPRFRKFGARVRYAVADLRAWADAHRRKLASNCSGTTAPAEPPARQRDDSAAAASLEFLTTEEAAVFLRVSPRTLEKRRLIGGSPRFRKFGVYVRYSVADLRSWADRHAFGMTSDPGLVQRASVR